MQNKIKTRNETNTKKAAEVSRLASHLINELSALLHEDIAQYEERCKYPEGSGNLLEFAGAEIDQHICDHTEHDAL